MSGTGDWSKRSRNSRLTTRYDAHKETGRHTLPRFVAKACSVKDHIPLWGDAPAHGDAPVEETVIVRALHRSDAGAVDITAGDATSSSAPTAGPDDALPVVWLAVDELEPAAIGELRWRLHTLLTGRPCRVVVQLKNLDEENELAVFAVLMNAERLTHMRGSELLVAQPPARF